MYACGFMCVRERACFSRAHVLTHVYVGTVKMHTVSRCRNGTHKGEHLALAFISVRTFC